METFLICLLAIICCGLSLTIGFFWGRGQIAIIAPLSKDERERRERLLRKSEEFMEQYNQTTENIFDFGGRIDGL